MARLPDVDNLGARPIPQSRERFVPAARPGMAIAEGLNSLTNVGFQIREKQDRLAFAKAKSDYLIEDVKARAELENDQEWETYEPRYRERMKKARDKVMGQIRDKNDRVLFEQDSTLDMERGAMAVRGLSRKVETDAGLATLDSVLESNRNAALEAHDEPTRSAFIDSAHEAIQGALEKGYIDKKTAGTLRERWTESYAEGHVSMLSPEERISVLSDSKGVIARAIDPDKRTELIRRAQNEGRELRVRRESQAAEDSIFSKGGSLESMRQKARAIEDPEVRDSTIARLEARVADREADRERGDRQLRRAAWDVVLKGGGWEDIPTNVVASMDPEDGIQIKNYLASASKEGGVKTDIPTWYGLKQLEGSDPKAFAELDLLKYRSSLSESDFQAAANSQEKIRESVEAGYAVQTDNQMVETALRSMGIRTGVKAKEKDNQRASAFRYKFEQELTALTKEQGKKPTPEQKRAVLDRMSIEVVTDSGWSGKEKRLFEVNPDEQIEEVVVPKAERKQIVDALKRRGIDPTDERVQSLYLRAKQR